MVTTVAAPSVKGVLVIWYEFSCFPFCLVMFDSKWLSCRNSAISVDQILKWHLIVPNVFTPFIYIFFSSIFGHFLLSHVLIYAVALLQSWLDSLYLLGLLIKTFFHILVLVCCDKISECINKFIPSFHLTQESSSSSGRTCLTKVINTWQKYLSFMQINGSIHMCINWLPREKYISDGIFFDPTINVFFLLFCWHFEMNSIVNLHVTALCSTQAQVCSFGVHTLSRRNIFPLRTHLNWECLYVFVIMSI